MRSTATTLAPQSVEATFCVSTALHWAGSHACSGPSFDQVQNKIVLPVCVACKGKPALTRPPKKDRNMEEAEDRHNRT